jgi:hypothetical protein
MDRGRCPDRPGPDAIGRAMIYKVLIETEGISEEVTLAAESEEEAKEIAIDSAVNRAMANATITVTPMPPAAA